MKGPALALLLAGPSLSLPNYVSDTWNYWNSKNDSIYIISNCALYFSRISIREFGYKLI